MTGAGPTTALAQNGVQISLGATGTVTDSMIIGNNYTGSANASAAGVLVFGGGGSVCGIGKISPLVKNASIKFDTLLSNDVGVALFNVDSTCSKSPRTPTRDTVCYNVIRNYHGYSHGEPSADANVAGFLTGKGKLIGDQAGVSDSGNADVICYNSISGGGYAARPVGLTAASPSARLGRARGRDNLDGHRLQPSDLPLLVADIHCQPRLACPQPADAQRQIAFRNFGRAP